MANEKTKLMAMAVGYYRSAGPDETPNATAIKFGVSGSSLRAALRKAGVPPEPMGRRLKPEVVQAAQYRIKRKCSLVEAAEQFGVSVSATRIALIRLGATPNPRGKPMGTRKGKRQRRLPVDRLLMDVVQTARKYYTCNACEIWEGSGLGECDITAEDWATVREAEADKWRITPGQKYRKMTYRDENDDFVTYRARPDMDKLCRKLGLGGIAP